MVKISNLDKPIVFELLGQEAWLADVRKTFSLGFSEVIKGSITVEKVSMDEAKVFGHLSLVPKMPCSHCSQPLEWPIHENFSVVFKHPKDITQNAVDLTEDDLETYELDANNQVDLEQVVNDVIQTAIPSRIVKIKEGDKGQEICLVCDDFWVADQAVVADPKGADVSPFASLASLRDKLK